MSGIPPTDARGAASAYLDAGYAPIWLPPREKNPNRTGWQKTTRESVRLDDFTTGRGVGLNLGEPSGGLADADLDWAEAVRAAAVLMPDTGLIGGRPSAPASHRFYTVPDRVPYLKLTDPTHIPRADDDASSDRACILEGRGDGRQTVVAPSLHKDTGEQYLWHRYGTPRALPSAAEFHRILRAAAAAALLGRHWPKNSRHDAALFLAGGLLRAWGTAHRERVEKFVTAVCAAAQDDELPNRLAAVRDTAGKLSDDPNSPVGGWPKFAQLVDKRVADKVVEWLGIRFDKPADAGKRVSEVSNRRTARTPRPLPPWVPFPVHLLPPVVAEFTTATAEAMVCDPAYVALPALTAVAAAIGTTHLAAIRKTWKEPPLLWTTSIGSSGVTKSQPYRLVVEGVCEDINDELEDRYDQELAGFQQAAADWEERNRAKEPDLGPKPKPPVLKEFVKGDITIEALVTVLQDNPRGVLIGWDEMSGWIGGFVRYAGKAGASALPQWLSLSNAGTVSVTRKTGDRRKVRVRGVGVCFCGTIQPHVIATAMTPELRHAGLFARLLPVYPPRRLRVWSEPEVPDAVLARYGDLIRTLFALEMGTWPNGRPKPTWVPLTPEAKRAFIDFYNANGQAMYYDADDSSAAQMSKLEAYAVRFALVFHCCRHSDSPANQPISREDMLSGIALTRWFIHESDRCLQMLGETEADRDTRTKAEQVARKCSLYGGRISERDFQRSNSRKYRTAAEATAVLEGLVGDGYGVWEEAEDTGRRGGHRVRYYRPVTPCMTHDTSDTRPDGEDEDDDGPHDARDDTRPDRPDDGPRPDGSNPAGDGGCVETSDHAREQVSEVSCVEHEQEPAEPARRPTDAPGQVSDPPPASVIHGAGYTLVTDHAGLALLAAAVEDDGGPVGLDAETTGKDPRTGRCRLLQIATARDTFLIDLFAVAATRGLWDALAAVEVVGHNLAFDLGFLGPLGFTPGRCWDAMLASQVLDAGGGFQVRHGLKEVAARHLNADIDKTEQRSDWSGPLTASQLEYAAADAVLPLRIREVMLPKLAAADLLPTAELEMRALPAMAWLSCSGVGFDATGWGVLADEAEAERQRLVAELDAAIPNTDSLFAEGTRNWDSPQQVQAAFASVGVTLASTDDDALSGVAHPAGALLRDYRSAVKRATTYGPTWVKTALHGGRLYPGWKQIGAGSSGRMSCKGPNAQNLPRDKRYRRCFVAPPGRTLVKADYSQIELRLAARIAGEKTMLAAYKAGQDLHTLTAASITGKPVEQVTKADRQLAKAVNFGLLYGMGAPALAGYALANYGVRLTEAEALGYRNKFFAAYPGLKGWHRRAGGGDQPVDTRTVLGRRRVGVKRYSEKLNTPVQGSGADGLKAALALLWDRRAECSDALPVLAVHDEIVVECDADRADPTSNWLKRAMVDGMEPFAAPVPVEVEVSIGPTWAG